MIVAYLDGIGTEKLKEGDGRSILDPIAQKIAADPRLDARVIRIAWPAQMAGLGGPMTWKEASEVGVRNLSSIVERNPDEDLVLLAYSGGNLPLHDWLDQNPQHHHRVKAAGFMSDPFRPYGHQQAGTPGLPGWGICGQRETPIMNRSFWTSVRGDVISDALPDALLRTVADLSPYIPGGFLDGLWGHHRDGSWQLAWQLHIIRTNPLHWLGTLGPRLHQARVDIEGYMNGRHTKAYYEPFDTGDGRLDSLASRFAASIAWKVSR